MFSSRYSYVTHPNSLPLQLSGTSKRHPLPLKKENFNQNRCMLTQQSKSFLIGKLAYNVHQFGQSKSILPETDPRRKTRIQSIKTFKNNQKSVVSRTQQLFQKEEGKKQPKHQEHHYSERLIEARYKQQIKNILKRNLERGDKEVQKKQFNDSKIKERVIANKHKLQFNAEDKQESLDVGWNDINDSDSSLESQPEQEIVQVIKQNDKSQPKKESISNPKNGCTFKENLGDPYSLEKLEKHSSSTMWLYITNYNSQKADQIHQLLTKSNHFSQIIRLKTVGWNVETTSETGKQLIYQGLKGDNFAIKFIYSKKNEQRQSKQQDKQKNSKLQKKVTYVQKGKDAGLKKFSTFTEQPKNKEKIEDQEAYSPRDKDLKQKGKYIQKKTSSNSYNDFRKFQSPRANKNIRDFKSPKRYVEKVASNIESKNSDTVKKTQEKTVSQTVQQKNQEKPNTVPKQIEREQQIKKVIVEERVQQKLQKYEKKQTSLQKKQELKVEEEDQSEQEVKQQKKKKNKKKRDGKAKKQQNKLESNNPFSYFSRF